MMWRFKTGNTQTKRSCCRPRANCNRKCSGKVGSERTSFFCKMCRDQNEPARLPGEEYIYKYLSLIASKIKLKSNPFANLQFQLHFDPIWTKKARATNQIWRKDSIHNVWFKLPASPHESYITINSVVKSLWFSLWLYENFIQLDQKHFKSILISRKKTIQKQV